MIESGLEYTGNYWLTTQLTIAARDLAGEDVEKLAEVEMGITARGFAWDNTPVVSGSWANAWAVMREGDETFLGIPPTAVNPYSDENPPEYAPKVHTMGGVSRSGHRRDVLNVLVDVYGQDILVAGGESVIASLRAVLP